MIPHLFVTFIDFQGKTVAKFLHLSIPLSLKILRNVISSVSNSPLTSSSTASLKRGLYRILIWRQMIFLSFTSFLLVHLMSLTSSFDGIIGQYFLTCKTWDRSEEWKTSSRLYFNERGLSSRIRMKEKQHSFREFLCIYFFNPFSNTDKLRSKEIRQSCLVSCSVRQKIKSFLWKLIILKHKTIHDEQRK